MKGFEFYHRPRHTHLAELPMGWRRGAISSHKVPNQLALKMDGAGASGPYPAVAGSRRGARGTGAGARALAFCRGP